MVRTLVFCSRLLDLDRHYIAVLDFGSPDICDADAPWPDYASDDYESDGDAGDAVLNIMSDAEDVDSDTLAATIEDDDDDHDDATWFDQGEQYRSSPLAARRRRTSPYQALGHPSRAPDDEDDFDEAGGLDVVDAEAF